MSTIAAILSLGLGGAYAATSIGTRQIRNGAVTAKKLHNAAVTAKKIHKGAVTRHGLALNAVVTGNLADGSVVAGKLADGAVDSAKVADNSLTGTDILESSLGQVPSALNSVTATNATQLGGRGPAGYLSSAVYKNESPVEAGTTLGDGTQVISEACNPGDVLLSGGPANIASTTTLLESFPSPGVTNSWTARVNKNGHTDNFSVVVLCIQQ